MWLRYRPDSALARWFRERVGAQKGRVRRIAIVALARKLAVALWHYLEHDVPYRRRRDQELNLLRRGAHRRRVAAAGDGARPHPWPAQPAALSDGAHPRRASAS